MAAITTRAPVGLGVFARLVSAVADRWHSHMDYVRTRDQLWALTDRELEDIGIARYQIREVANGTYRG